MVTSENKNVSSEFQQISENITIVIWKAKVNEKYEFEETFISPIIDEILGLPKGTIKNDWNKFFGYVKPEYLTEIQATFQKAFMSPGTTEGFDYQVIKADGKIAYFYSTGRCTVKNNELFVFGTTTDITKQKEAEIALKISEKKIKKQNLELQKINAEKNKLFSIISHDLRSPFNALIGFSTILHKKIDSYEMAKTKKMILSIKNIATGTYDLLDDLLEWANFHSGQIKFKPKTIDLLNFTALKINLIENFAAQKEIEIENKISETTEIFADEHMISLIFRNLLTNAIKFTHRNGKISIFTTETDKNIEISIKDNGIGIVQEKQEILFQMNNNISSQGTENETGTGLGLILCREFVEKHDGKIWVKSEPEKGSIFTFSIPKIE